MKVAIVCDWLSGIGGAERVVLELHKMFPEAPIYTSQYDPKRIDWFGDADVRTTWLQKLPKGLKKFLPPLRAWTFSRLNLDDYDVVISSSGAEAKFVKTKPGTIHICYCHAPTHYYWDRYNEYLKRPGFGWLNPIARLGLLLLVRPMRQWDWRAAQRPSYFVANSHYTKAQIKKYYGRDSTVIHPPVDVEYFKPREKLERQGFVTAGRQTPYKRFDLAVAACTELNIPLKVIGNGPEHRKLTAMAGPRVMFLEKVSREEMPRHFGQAEAFIFPGIDDFGIVAVEALAAGTPVIAYGQGGTLDYIKDGQTGLLFNEQTPDSLIEAVERFQKLKRFSGGAVTKKALAFRAESFQRNFRKFMGEKLLK